MFLLTPAQHRRQSRTRCQRTRILTRLSNRLISCFAFRTLCRASTIADTSGAAFDCHMPRVFLTVSPRSSTTTSTTFLPPHPAVATCGIAPQSGHAGKTNSLAGGYIPRALHIRRSRSTLIGLPCSASCMASFSHDGLVGFCSSAAINNIVV